MKKRLASTAILVAIVLLALLAPVVPTAAQGSCPDSWEPNNDGGHATQLQPGVIMATICPKDDVDVYKFSVSAGDSIDLSLTHLPADYDVGLWSRNKWAYVAISENGGTSEEHIQWKAELSDQLYVVVMGYNGATAPRPYAVVLKYFPRQVDLDSRTSDSSAQIKEEFRTKLPELRVMMTDSDYESFLEFAQYATNATKCITEIKAGKAAGMIVATTELARACGMMTNEIVKVLSKYIFPDPAGGGERADLDLTAYCIYKYGYGAVAEAANPNDAYSWGCYISGRYMGGMNMHEACRLQHPGLDYAIMADRWDASSWFCRDWE